jgi:hypothetical protein
MKKPRRCESEWPLIVGDSTDWWKCQKRGAHRVCQAEGTVYDNLGVHEALITLKWRVVG